MGQRHVGHHAYAQHHQIGGQQRTVAAQNLRDAPGPQKFASLDILANVDAIRCMHVFEVRRCFGCHRPLQDTPALLQHRDLHAHPAQRRGRLQPDVASTHDDRSATRVNLCGDRASIRCRSQIVHTCERSAGQRKLPRASARTQRELVVVQCFAIGQKHALALPIHRDDTHTQHAGDARLFIGGRTVDGKGLNCLRGLQRGLGKRRALVRQSRLVADQKDRAGPAFTPQAEGELGPGMARADDDADALCAAHRGCARAGMRCIQGCAPSS
ncbi:hypothetical protein D9M68_624710 [compost metagenome]